MNRRAIPLPVLVASAATAVSLGCERELPPAGQVVLYVDTDAVVREPADRPIDASLFSPFVDRARFETVRDGQPLPQGTREFAIDSAMLRDRRLSFGVVLPPGLATAAVRVRLFRADRVFGPEPDPGVTLDTIVALPPVGAEGVTELSVLLESDAFGARIGPVAPSRGAPERSLVGTWRGGRRTQCADGALPGEACVPGTAFFFGDPHFRGRTPANDISDERLVFVSPFYLDLTEVTVGAFRRRWPDLQGRVAEPTAESADAYCTWTASTEGEGSDARALNCVSWFTALAYCELVGKTLPTEAQLELVSSGLGEEWGFPWGDEEPDCQGAVWGLAGIASAASEQIKRGAGDCREPRLGVIGPLPPGQGQSDKLTSSVLRNLGGGEIEDLGGNLGEWARDVWARPTDTFWSTLTPMVDPLNTEASAVDGDLRPIRGGDWASTALTTRAGFRRRRSPSDQVSHVGFRCARPATPL